MPKPFLAEFLLTLATDRGVAQRFSRTPEEIMREYGLSDTQIEAVLSQSEEQVHAAIIAETDDLLPDIYCGKIRTYQFFFEQERSPDM